MGTENLMSPDSLCVGALEGPGGSAQPRPEGRRAPAHAGSTLWEVPPPARMLLSL